MPKKKGKNFSANNATGKRKKSDFYETPYTLTRKFLDVEDFDKDKSICEPACGGGAITKVLKEYWNDDLITAYDKETNFLWDYNNYNYIITNPPYSLAFEFIQRAKQLAKLKFALLLPLYYLHGKKRYDEIFSDRSYGLEKIYVFTRSPMLGETLREDGKHNTGMMPYSWYVWTNGYSGQPILDWIDNNGDILTKKDLEIKTELTDNSLSDIINNNKS